MHTAHIFTLDSLRGVIEGTLVGGEKGKAHLAAHCEESVVVAAELVGVEPVRVEGERQEEEQPTLGRRANDPAQLFPRPAEPPRPARRDLPKSSQTQNGNRYVLCHEQHGLLSNQHAYSCAVE
jgi:hypothetical protein